MNKIISNKEHIYNSLQLEHKVQDDINWLFVKLTTSIIKQSGIATINGYYNMYIGTMSLLKESEQLARLQALQYEIDAICWLNRNISREMHRININLSRRIDLINYKRLVKLEEKKELKDVELIQRLCCKIVQLMGKI